jgi:hypothetical protein
MMATAIAPTANTTSLSGPSSVDPITEATRHHNWVFAAYIFAGFFLAVMTYLVARSGNKLQDVVRINADARIAEARAEGAKANERAEKLEKENLTLKGSVAGLEKNASDAKAEQQRVQTALVIQQGKTASLETAASEAKAAQKKVEKEVAVQQERAANAEKALLELQEKVKDRHLTPLQKAQLVGVLNNQPKGAVIIRCVLGSPELNNFGKEISEVFTKAGWDVKFEEGLLIIPPASRLRDVDTYRPKGRPWCASP